MNRDYEDIRSRIPESPKWFDEYAVPRYCDFSPNKVADIYACEAALVKIACQSCFTKFKVAFSAPSHRLEDIIAKRPHRTLASMVQERTIHYGDPPNIGCCDSGPIMNSDPLMVLEFWRKGDGFEWERDRSLEVDISD